EPILELCRVTVSLKPFTQRFPLVHLVEVGELVYPRPAFGISLSILCCCLECLNHVIDGSLAHAQIFAYVFLRRPVLVRQFVNVSSLIESCPFLLTRNMKPS